MPELPEVESVVRALRPLIRGKTILGCEVLHSIAVRPQRPAELHRGADGQRVQEIERRGKYLLLRLGQGDVVMHFRLDGQLVWFDPGRVSGHIDVAFHFSEGTLGFVDRRHFGRVQWCPRAEELPSIRALGLDPLSADFQAQRFQKLLARSQRPLKLLLTDQTRLAGLGNIYASEALWQARLSPRRRAHRVAPPQARQLHKAIVEVLRRALECCLDPAPDFRDPNWWFQGLDRILRVYDREGESCRRCGGRIRRIEQGGRSSYYCPGCQE